MDTRRCSGCREEKTIRGVWFLVNGEDGSGEPTDGSDFICEECYSQRTDGLRGSNLQREPGRRGGTPTG